jgi:2-dehydro-3-deoxygluconokinase
MTAFAAFGEIMLRLSPTGSERLFQSHDIRAFFGGAEANVAVSLAIFGRDVRYISVIPEGEIGDAAVRELAKWGVYTEYVVRRGKRLGIYFAEPGANQRPSKVIYDRDGSGIAEARRGDIEWEQALSSVAWLHLTGITPALSAGAADLTLEAARTAKGRGITVSLDLNYRAKLWNYGKSAPEVMRELVGYADVVMANEEDCQKSLGISPPAEIKGGAPDPATYELLTKEVMEHYPNISRIAVTLRKSRSADSNGWSAVLRNRNEFLVGSEYDIPDIVDRVGSGDAFAAGLIHGLTAFSSDREAMEFAVAASCLKHSIPGDFNLVSEKDVLALLGGQASGRVQR